MNNQEQPEQQILHYLDGELSGQKLYDFEQLLSSKPEMREELENLKIARLALEHYGLHKQVSSLHLEMMEELGDNSQKKSSGKNIYLLLRGALQIAASVLVFLFLFGSYEYLTVKSSKLYKSTYSPYELGTVRGEDVSSMEASYLSNDFKKVVFLFKSNTRPGLKEHFLAAQAYLSLNQPLQAIPEFILVLNNHTGNEQYKDDAEYYLSLSYLAANDPSKASILMEKIHENSDHLYHDQVSFWVLLRLKLLVLKQPGK